MVSALLRRWAPLAAVALLLLFAGGLAARSSPQLSRVEPDTIETPLFEPGDGGQPPPTAPPTDAEFAPAEPASTPGWLATAATVTLGVGLAGALVVGVWTLLRDRARRRAGAVLTTRPVARRDLSREAEQVAAAMAAGLVDLSDTDLDPRKAVIACWVRLEEAAAAVGVTAQPGDTSTDLVIRLLHGHQLSGPVLAGFAEIYRRARYGTHAVDGSMRDEARAALHQLRAELTGVAA